MKTFDFLPDSQTSAGSESTGKSKRKDYTRPDVGMKTRIAALSAAGLSFRKIATDVGVSDKTVASVLKEPAVVEDVQKFEKRFARKLEETAEKILDRITETDIEKSSLKDKCISIGVLTDKSRLVKGQSTSNQSILFSIVEEACRQRINGAIDITPTSGTPEA